jgi:hypothetical protein
VFCALTVAQTVRNCARQSCNGLWHFVIRILAMPVKQQTVLQRLQARNSNKPLN